jgi:hypothetical protein
VARASAPLKRPRASFPSHRCRADFVEVTHHNNCKHTCSHELSEDLELHLGIFGTYVIGKPPRRACFCNHPRSASRGAPGGPVCAVSLIGWGTPKMVESGTVISTSKLGGCCCEKRSWNRALFLSFAVRCRSISLISPSLSWMRTMRQFRDADSAGRCRPTKKLHITSFALKSLLVLPTDFSGMYCSPPGQVLPPPLTL